MRILLILFASAIFFLSCKKDNVPYGYYMRMTLDGKKTTVGACGTSSYLAEISRDTALFVSVQCGGEGIGFSLKGNIVDGTYELNALNKAFYFYYNSGYIFYSTNSSQKGSLIISSTIYQNKPSLKGEFEFKAVDTASGKVITITNGSFLLEKYRY